jgi:hypothetical protein
LDWKKLTEWCVLECPVYSFTLDEYGRGADRMVFAHLAVHKWSLSGLKQIIHDFTVFRQHVVCPLYAVALVDDEKWSAFVGLLGFKFLTNVLCENGEQRRLFVSLKEEQKSDDAEDHLNHPGAGIEPDRSVGRTSPVSDAGI